MNNISQAEILNYAIENGMIDFNTIQIEIEMNKRKKYLQMHEYNVWQGKNGQWYTYLPDDEKGRLLKKRKTREEIEDCIIEYYKAVSDDEKEKKRISKITLLTIFPEWIKYKGIHTDSTSYIARITADWRRFYTKEVKLINTPLKNLTALELDNWAHGMIKKHELTKKSYYNMSMILRQCLDYAVYCGYIDENVFAGIKINSKMFRRVKKKSGETEVYTVEEEKRLVEDMLRRFNDNKKNTAPLAVIFAFETGVRIGELCALKFSDIEGNYINIQRQEVRNYEEDGDYKMKFKDFSVVEYTKSEDSYRSIYMTETARQIINLVKKTNFSNNEYSEEGFIFVRKGKNINHYAIQAMILRGCKKIGINLKTCHKIRKTYISTLIDSGLNIDQIRKMAGHSDERTTYGNYCFNRKTDEQTELHIENASNLKEVIKGNQILIG